MTATKGQGTSANKLEALSVERLDCSTIGQLLGLPAAYKIESCVIVINSKNECIKINAAPLDIPIGKIQQLDLFVQQIKGKGFNLTLDEIHVAKGDRKLKLISKTFTL